MITYFAANSIAILKQVH